MPKPLSKPRTFKIHFPTVKEGWIWLRIQPHGIIELKESHARRWLPFPLSRLYVLAADAAASRKTGL
jgi:hypothetical protein